MKVDFNNVRKQACYSYDRLVERLNSSIHRNDEYAEMPNGRVGNLKGHVVIDADEIEDELNNLRQLIGTIAMTHVENDENFKDVYPADRSMAVFNEKDDY